MTTEFTKKQQAWKEQLNGKDRHAIWRRIADLLKYDAVWRTYNEARRISRVANDPSTGLTGSIIQVLDEGFFCLQVFEISKLVEKNWDKPEKHIYSLRRLLDEIKEDADLYTREAYVTFDGVTYEEEDAENPRLEPERSYRHSRYDIISGFSESKRSKEDKLCEEYLNRIETEFHAFVELKTYRNKYLAHAASPEHRPDDILDKITLAYLDRCYQALIKIGKMIELLLVDEILVCEVPVAQYDVLENWDKPAVASNDISKLRAYWDIRLSEIEAWNKTATLI